jgi:ABC-type multidrug transport system fused ATPase/permease subunit
VDLQTLDPAAWQRRVAAIFQGFVRYELSVYDNISLGAPERQHDDAAVRDAARRAGILDVIEALPHGWETVLSRQFLYGTDLSGGQWQRLALARALFATSGREAGGAGILVLDEPTANLDVRTEADLYDRFLDLTAGLTTVVISHRFSTVRRADHIVVIDGGRVVEEGTHASLVAAGGRYATLFALQAERYVDDASDDLVDTHG